MTGRVNMTKLNQTTQVVVPKKYRLSIMTMAHEKSGHLGIEKSKDRILAHLYWPGVFKDVMQHCRSCDACQNLSKVWLPIPVIDIPFKKIGIGTINPMCEKIEAVRDRAFLGLTGYYQKFMRNANNRLMRWSSALQEFNFVVHYKKGSSNGNADGLSRA